MEMTELALDLRAIADAELDAMFVLAVRDFLEGVVEEIPDPRLYGMTEEEGAKLAAEAARIVLADEAAEHGAWFADAAEIDAAFERIQRTG